MKQAAHPSIANRATTRRGHLAVAISCVALAAGCSTSSSTRHGAAPGSTAVPTTASTSATVLTTTTTTPPITYRVKRGDTLTTIAHHFHVAISAIVSANHVANPDRLTEGQTLRIPPARPLKLVATPSQGHAGQAFQLMLTGAVPSETIKFEIDSAASKYTGGPHTASADGAVTATYQTALGARTGIYTVTATGNLGSTAQIRFRIVAAATTSTT
ncbi:MAG: LysM domain [Actinomycetota bacterium]|jgi:lipoprotein NlpD|nr:LysM domain [Actinomycetota bacterium]